MILRPVSSQTTLSGQSPMPPVGALDGEAARSRKVASRGLVNHRPVVGKPRPSRPSSLGKPDGVLTRPS